MNIKLIIYLIILPITMWSAISLRLDYFFKKNSLNQIKIFYFILSISITYLVTQFIFDFYQITAMNYWKEYIWF